MKKTRRFLALLLALMMVLQIVPAVGAADVQQVNAAYTDTSSSISADTVGYYWDGAYLYYADGAKVNAYSLTSLGVKLTDYNQVHNVTIGGTTIAVKFCSVPADVLSAAATAKLHPTQNYNMGVSGNTISFSNMAADSTITDASKAKPTATFVVAEDTSYGLTDSIVLEQTLCFDALPESGKVNQSFEYVSGMTYAYGPSSFMYYREPATGNAMILAATVQNEGGKLVMYLCNNGQYSAGVSATVDLGKTLGETFQLSIRWNPDYSAVIYVDGVEKGRVEAGLAGRVIGAMYARGVCYGVSYSNLEGDAKFTVTDLKVTSAGAMSVAQDTTSADLTALVAKINSNVYADITLPDKVVYECGAMPIYWTSSNPAVLGNDGKIVSLSAAATAVTLTATAGGQTVEKTVNVMIDPNAAYVKDAASINAADVGYYWDGANLYVADGAKVNAYSLASLGVNLTDYNQVHTVTIDGASVAIKFCPGMKVLSDTTADSFALATYNNFNMGWDGKTIRFSNMTADSTVTDASLTAPYASFASLHDTTFSHAEDMVLEQTMRFDALPESGKQNQSFVGNVLYAHGHSTFIYARDVATGNATAFITTVQNEGGELVLYLCNNGQYSAGVSATVKLGKTLGETFQLSIRWNADNSAVVYVDGVQMGSAAAGTVGRPFGAPYARGMTYGVCYSNLTGDCKFSISDMKITAVGAGSIAEDTAETDLATLVAAVADKTVGDLELPDKLAYTSGAMPIYWTSSNPDVLSNTGKVISPEVETQVTLTATAFGQSAQKTVTVIPNPYVEPTQMLVAFPADCNLVNLFVADKETGTYTLSGASATNAYLMGYTRPAIDHKTNDLILVQDVKIDALPETAYTFNGSTGNKGLALVLTDRVNGDGQNCEGMLAYIINEGGKLKLYVDDCAAVDLGKGLGEKFTLTIEWNKDNSAYVYVDGACKGILSDVLCTTNYMGNDNIQYYCNADGNVNITLSNCAVYMGVNDIRNQLRNLTIADVLAGIYTDTITGDLPNYYMLNGRKLAVKWIADGIAANGDVTLGETERTVTVNALVGGMAIKSAEMTIKAATTVDIDYSKSVAHASEWNDGPYSVLNMNVLSNFALDGNTFTFDNTGHSNISGLIGTNSKYYAIDHAVYDLLMEQTVRFEVLPENRNGIDVFGANNGKGYYFFVNDRYNHNPEDYTKYLNGDEHMMLASIQNEDGQLMLYIAGNDKTATAARARFYLGKTVGETFTLSTLWTTENTLTVYVDGEEIGTLADCQRDVTYAGADCGNIGYKDAPDAIAIFTVSDVTIYSLGNLAKVGDEAYADLEAAFAAAAAGEDKTVTLIDTVVADEIVVPAGVTLELDGFNVRAANILSFGDVVDHNASVNAQVTITDDMVLAENNSQIPLYYNVGKYYYFTDMGAASLGARKGSDKVTFGFKLDMAENLANYILSLPELDGEYTGLTATITLDWTGSEGAVPFVISDDMMRTYGAMAYKYASTGLTTALMLHVNGLDTLAAGDMVTVDMTVTSDSGVVVDFDDIIYEIVPA